MTTTTTTKTRLTQAQRETLQELLRASAAATAAAAALKEAKTELENAELAALPILEDEPRTIRDEDGTTRTILVSLSKSYTAAGTAAQRVRFAKEHGLNISAPDCSTAALKTVASDAMAAGLLVPVPKIVID
jgi:hypothetical protein